VSVPSSATQLLDLSRAKSLAKKPVVAMPSGSLVVLRLANSGRDATSVVASSSGSWRDQVTMHVP
jgi:hypothetical protein